MGREKIDPDPSFRKARNREAQKQEAHRISKPARRGRRAGVKAIVNELGGLDETHDFLHLQENTCRGNSRQNKGPDTMSEDIKDNTLPVPVANDGFDETETSDRVIQGTLLKCVDGVWTDRDGQPAPKTPLLALSTSTIIQHWQDQKPVQTITKQPGRPLPDIDDLNAQIPQSEWEDDPITGKPRAPWQLQKVVYLLCEITAERFTYANGTTGTHIAVDNLRTRVKDMRFMRGETVLPVVELSNKPMKTRYGQKLRPEFKIISWRDAGPSTPQITGEKGGGGGGMKEIAPPTTEEELRDKVPY
jgi:hypothetical protein